MRGVGRPMLRALLLLVLLVLAGCAAPEGGDAGPTPTGGASRFLAPVELAGQGGPEPVIVFSPEGDRVYVAAQDPFGRNPTVWISKDAGATWTARTPTAEGGGEVDLATGAGGMVYLTQLGARGNVVSVSRDHGETWETAPLGGASQYFDREWLAVDAQGRVFVVAREFATTASAGVARSDDRGLTFPPRGKAWTALDEPGEANGPLVASGSAVHLVYVCRGAEAVCLATSRDGGLTWRQDLVADRGTNVANVYPALAATSRGLLVAWSDARDGALAVYVSESTDGGASWSSARRVSPAGGTSTLPWLAGRGSTAWVAYLRADEALRATDCAEATQARWIPHALPLLGGGVPSGDPIALTTEPVHVGVISPPVGVTCSGGSRDRNFGDFFTAALGPDGKLVVVISTDRGDPAGTRDLVIRER